jgi:hypothetical protein
MDVLSRHHCFMRECSKLVSKYRSQISFWIFGISQILENLNARGIGICQRNFRVSVNGWVTVGPVYRQPPICRRAPTGLLKPSTATLPASYTLDLLYRLNSEIRTCDNLLAANADGSPTELPWKVGTEHQLMQTYRSIGIQSSEILPCRCLGTTYLECRMRIERHPSV